MNRWNIPDSLEREVRDRDQRCVYCGGEFGSSGQRTKSMATWEHIVNDARIVNSDNIVRCCVACNASKGTKRLSDWLESEYCRKRGITRDTVAEVVRRRLAIPPNASDPGP
jgi:hypothetical protein